RGGVEPEDPPGSRGKVKREAAGARPDVEYGTTVERLLVEPPDQGGREGPMTTAVAGRAPARLLQVPSHAGASVPSILRGESAPRCVTAPAPIRIVLQAHRRAPSERSCASSSSSA